MDDFLYMVSFITFSSLTNLTVIMSTEKKLVPAAMVSVPPLFV